MMASAIVLGVLAGFLASGDGGQSFAFLVSSNRGGAGQAALRYAQSDAKRVADVLVELGDVAPERLTLLHEPTPSETLEAIDGLEDQLQDADRAGIPTRLFFYYSGHARAHALSLGADELLLMDLRERLLALPARVTVIMLDACQSGAFSRIKGAEAAEDFSVNSLARLNAEGVAVLASSSASELSQESDTLRASIFTHHLVAALRGAADTNDDAKVTLGEVYNYVYGQTLVSTAHTTVGKQHATLETDLRTKGELALTSLPEGGRLIIEKPLKGELTVIATRDNTVVAELHKVTGHPVRLTLPHGSYRVLWRDEERLKTCALRIATDRDIQLTPAACTEDSVTELRTKSNEPAPIRWGLELGVGLAGIGDSPYTERLNDFGFESGGSLIAIQGTWNAALSYRTLPWLEIVMRVEHIESRSFARTPDELGNSEATQTFVWDVDGAALYGRLLTVPSHTVAAYAQVGLGATLTRTSFVNTLEASPTTDSESFTAWQVGGGIGVQVTPWRHMGWFVQLNYLHVPALKNLLDETHDAGGFVVATGLRGQL